VSDSRTEPHEDPWIPATMEALKEPTTRILDLRPTPAFFGGHLPGSLHLPPGSPDLAPGRTPDSPPGAGLRRELDLIWQEAERWVVIHPLAPPGPRILAAWCQAGHALATIGEATPDEVADLVATEGVVQVSAAAPPDFDTLAGEGKAVVMGSTPPVRALVASLLRRRGIPEVLVLVD